MATGVCVCVCVCGGGGGGGGDVLRCCKVWKARDRGESFLIAVKFDRCLDSIASAAPAKFQIDTSLTPDLTPSRLCEITLEV